MGDRSGTATRIGTILAVRRPPERRAYLTKLAGAVFSVTREERAQKRTKNLKHQSQNIILNQLEIKRGG